MKFVVVQKKSPHGLLLIVTDCNIVGKTFAEGKLILDLTKEFYDGAEKDEKEVRDLFFSARHIHLTGKYAVALGVSLNFVNAGKIIYVKKIPHAEVVID